MYYNTHGNFMSFAEFVETEVGERENYTPAQIAAWTSKYKLLSDSKCIWVCADPREAYRYSLPAEQHDNWEQIKYEEAICGAEEINPRSGFIILESDDGDGGFLFIANN